MPSVISNEIFHSSGPNVDRLRLYNTIDVLIPNFQDLGAQRVAVNAANGFHELGYTVRVVVFEKSGPFVHYLNPRIEIIELDTFCSSIRKLRVIQRIFSYYKLISHRGAEVAIAYTPIMNVCAIVAQFRTRNLKTIIQEHGYMSVALQDRSAHSRLFEIVYRFVFTKLYRYSDAVVVVTRSIRDDLVSEFGLQSEKVFIVNNPVDIGRIVQRSKESLDEKIAIPKPYIVGVGRMTGQKNFSRLLNIFARLCKETENIDLLLVGKGPMMSALVEESKSLKIEDRVHFVGFVTNPYPYIANAQLFCLTSDWEGLPQVIAESMICGTVVVAHECQSGPSDMIKDGVNGRLVPFGDEDKFFNAILEILRNPEQARILSRNAQETANRTYSLKEYLVNLQSVIRNL